METRTIRVYKPCETCGGTGLEYMEGYATDCDVCQGHGETLEIERKDVLLNDIKLPTRS